MKTEKIVSVNTNNPDWKIGQWCPRFFPDINFCTLGIANFLWGKIFAPQNAHVFFVLAGLHVYTVHACTMAGKYLHSFDMYIAAFVFAPVAAPEPAPGSDFSPLPLQLTAVAPPGSRRKLRNFPVWLITTMFTVLHHFFIIA